MSDVTRDAPQILLHWLTRMRWLAVIGQCGAVVVALVVFELELPLLWILPVIAATAISNLLLVPWAKPRVSWAKAQVSGEDSAQVGVSETPATVKPVRLIPVWLMPGVVMLDVILLTVILMLSGGATNPFTVLYVVHVAIAVFVLGGVWTWIVLAAVIACFLSTRVLPSIGQVAALPENAITAGQLVAMPLAATLIAYFVNKMHRAIESRELELARARRRVAQSERFTSLTALAAGAAHELGSPLGTIAITAKELELEAKRSSADPQLIEDAQLIREEVDRCRGILQRMRMDVGDDLLHKPGLVDSADLIRRASADLPEDQIALLQTEIEPGADRVWLSSRAVQRALGVLLRNAFDASPSRSRVMLSIGAKPGVVRFTVKDQGHGMAPEVLKRAGEPFFTTKEMGRGMGMGLFLVKLVAEQHGGSLSLSSEAGGTSKGTTAVLEFAVPR